jgi:rubrerythrin
METRKRPVGLSEWEERLYDHITDHVASESALLHRYEELAKQETGHVRFLLELIGEDEARHHRLYQQWVDTIKALPLAAPAGGLPDLVREQDPKALRAAVDELLTVEHDDTRHLRQLRKELKDFRDTTIWSLLVELMESDTQKHIKILEFLRDHAKTTAKHRR